MGIAYDGRQADDHRNVSPTDRRNRAPDGQSRQKRVIGSIIWG